MTEDRTLKLIQEKTTVTELARQAWIRTLTEIRSWPTYGFTSGPDNSLPKY